MSDEPEHILLNDALKDALEDSFAKELIRKASRMARVRRQQKQGLLACLCVVMLLFFFLHHTASPSSREDISSSAEIDAPAMERPYTVIKTQPGMVLLVRTQANQVTAISTGDQRYPIERISDAELIGLFADRSPRLEPSPDGHMQLIFSN